MSSAPYRESENGKRACAFGDVDEHYVKMGQPQEERFDGVSWIRAVEAER